MTINQKMKRYLTLATTLGLLTMLCLSAACTTSLSDSDTVADTSDETGESGYLTAEESNTETQSTTSEDESTYVNETGNTSETITSYENVSETKPEEPTQTESESTGQSSEDENSGEDESPTTPAQDSYILESIGLFELTAYCPCEKCCGIWAQNRPTDENGKPIVYTSSGEIAKEGVTIAADTSIYPFGTKLLIGDTVYTVQDRGSSIVGNRIDIYFESHEAALEFGRQKDVEVFLVVQPDGVDSEQAE